MKLIYVAGPYRSDTEWGLEENIQHAERAARQLWKDGWAVICPHKNTAHFGGVGDDSLWLDGDIVMLKRCDAIYMLNTWRTSKGAIAEREVAIECGLEVKYEQRC